MDKGELKYPVQKTGFSYMQKYREVLLYLIFGGIAFALNIVLYFEFNKSLGLNELIANVICWIICVLFQFITNRIWVFESKNIINESIVKQLAAFLGGRIVTLILEEIILAIFITWLKYNSIIIKLIAQVIVIILNYLISKYFVFN